MPLLSQLLQRDPKLEAAAVSDQAHIFRGAAGDHVLKLQSALVVLDNAVIDASELARSFYGPSTAASVLAFKTNRNIVNRSYQTQPDDIVGKMTIAALDREMLVWEKSQSGRICNRDENRYVNPNIIIPLL